MHAYCIQYTAVCSVMLFLVYFNNSVTHFVSPTFYIHCWFKDIFVVVLCELYLSILLYGCLNLFFIVIGVFSLY